MAFKKSTGSTTVPKSPDLLFRNLPKRAFPTEMPHQRAILQAYADIAEKHSDIAIQLPTGSGKTLVGLMIGEWRRQKNNEKVLYLCPTKQLAKQTARQAMDKCGLNVLCFTGTKKGYSPSDVAKYKNGDQIAISTYSSLFNTNPFFDDADTIIFDDSHAAENYLAATWSMEIRATEKSHTALHQAISNLIKPHITTQDFSRLTGRWDGPADATWVDKLPTPVFSQIEGDFTAIVSEHAEDSDLKYPWYLLRDSLKACHLYISSKSILLRPLIPPTWTLPAFEGAKHRIFMSATLGEGGDLERLTGRETIHRLAIPEGFELQGVGRRFFMFPGMSLLPGEVGKLRLQLIDKAGRAVVLTPSADKADRIVAEVAKNLSVPTFSAADIEDSKDPFIKEEKAVAVIAGRYDGIDFPNDECRLLCVDGLPRAMNAQERFIMSKMGAAVLFNERVQTRVLQAIGRCTRGLTDRSAVIVTGEELQDYLTNRRRRKYLYPELQAEIKFGVDQSIDVNKSDFIENFEMFWDETAEWDDANAEVTSDAGSLTKEDFPCMSDLALSVRSEIRYQKAIWSGDLDKAFEEAQSVLGKLESPELRGYRALWHYLAGSAAYLAAEDGQPNLMASARTQFLKAKGATGMLPWLAKLARYQPNSEEDTVDQDLMAQIEKLEGYLLQLGTTHDGKYAKLEKEILEGLSAADSFEHAHEKLGWLLGFTAGNEETDGSPDPWWLSKDFCLVFEDHAGALPESALAVKKARQAASHPNWIKSNLPEAAELKCIPVLVTPVSKAEKGAFPHLNDVYLWRLDDFKSWATNALSVVRQLRSKLTEPGDLVWRAEAAEKFQQEGMNTDSIILMLKKNIAAERLSLA